jgi:urea transport system substrate-binding protein
MLAKSPADRPATALEVARSLEAIERGPRPRRRLAAAAFAVVLAGALFFAGRSGAPSGEPIKVGVLHSLTGTMGTSEPVSIDATLLAIEEINRAGGVLGRPVRPVVADGRSDWEWYAHEAGRLIDEEHVAAIFGCWTSASRKRVKEVVEKRDHVLFYPMQYEGLEASPEIVYTGATPNQQVLPALRWACEHLGKRMVFVGSDYLWPHATCDVIRDQLPALGATLAGECYVSMQGEGTSEAVAKILETKPDLIVELLAGDSKVGFVRALRRAGVSSATTPTISFSSSQQGLAPADTAGDYSAWCYFSTFDSPRNRDFVKSYQEKFGPQRLPTDPVEASWLAVHLWAKAVEAAHGTDPREVRKAIRGVELAAPEGTVRVDPANLHTWRPASVARARADGSLEVVWTSPGPIDPLPFPATRSVEAWNELVLGYYKRWGLQWENRRKP